MKFIMIKLGEYEVRHENNHLCGHIDYNVMWEIFYFRPLTCGLDSRDCKDIGKFIDKLNRKYK